jgi:hypothetical protein
MHSLDYIVSTWKNCSFGFLKTNVAFLKVIRNSIFSESERQFVLKESN